MFFDQLIFDTPQLTQFINRTPNFKARDEARVVFSNHWDGLIKTFDGELQLRISCKQSDWLLSSLAQVCSSCFPPALIPTVERLYIVHNIDSISPLRWQNNIENSQWLELLHPFSGVKNLYMSLEFTPRLAPALKELVGERVTEVLPALQTLFLEEPLLSGTASAQEGIEQFVAARHPAGHPVSVSPWKGGRFLL